MNEDLIADLKQFITAAVFQATSYLATKDAIARLDIKIDAVEQRLDTKIDEVMSAVGDIVTSLNDTRDEQLADHEHRITRLEHRAI